MEPPYQQNPYPYAPPYGPPMPEVQYFAPPFAPSFVAQNANKSGGNLQYNKPMPMNNNTRPQPRRPESKPPMAPTRPAARPTPSGFTSINGPGSKSTGVSKQTGKMQALRLQYDDHRTQAALAAAARDLSELRTSSEKNLGQTKDAFREILDHCEAGALSAGAIMQKLYTIDEKVHNNGEKQRAIGDNLIVTQQEFQLARMDSQNILHVVQAAREEERSAREKSQREIGALREAVRIMSEGHQCQLDKVMSRLEEMREISQRASTPQERTEHAENVTTFPEEGSEIVVRAPEIARTKGPRRPRRSGGEFPPCDATVRIGVSSSRTLRSHARPRA